MHSRLPSPRKFPKGGFIISYVTNYLQRKQHEIDLGETYTGKVVSVTFMLWRGSTKTSLISIYSAQLELLLSVNDGIAEEDHVFAFYSQKTQ